jgi:hypothetical protein
MASRDGSQTGGEGMITWFAPVKLDQLAGYAVFLFDPNGAPEDPPNLDGIYDNLEEAKRALAAKGVFVTMHQS